MSKQLAYLEYSFMFDPGELWVSGSEFEKKLAEFFRTLDVEASTVDVVNGARRIFYLYKIERVVPPTMNQPVSKELKLPEIKWGK